MRLLALLVAVLAVASGVSADAGAAKRSAGCKTPLDLIASQNPLVPMHPVFQEILNSPKLKGTFFVPTAKAWDSFFATIRQRQGNPEAPAMVARYGQVMLYHLAQDITVPIATPTPGTPRFAFDTASTLQCSVGPALPNNRVVVRKTPSAIYLEHGTGNATIVSQPISYCGGEAYLVDQVLVPCSDVSAIMGEIANVPSPCKNNVEGVLQRNGLSYYNALLLATGVNRHIFAAVRPFTMFVPTDAAIAAAYESGSFNYPDMFAGAKQQLAGVVSYHAVPQVAHTAPSKYTASMETMLSQGHGNATCAANRLSYKPDGFVYGGDGASKVGSSYDRGCAAVMFTVDSLLQPCCKPMAQLLASLTAPQGSLTARALALLKTKVQGENKIRSSFVLPSEAAWDELKAEAKAANMSLGPKRLDALLQYLWTGADVADVVETATPVNTGLSLADPALRGAACPQGANATLQFAYDMAPPEAAQQAAAGAAADFETHAYAGAGGAGGLTGLPQAQLPGLASVQQLVGYGRRLAATKLPTGGAGAAAGGAALLLPTAFGQIGRPRDGASVVAGPIQVMDGAGSQLGLARGIPVVAVTYACDGAIFRVESVPLPCNFLGRTAAPLAPRAALRPVLAANLTISAAAVNTSGLPQAPASGAPVIPVAASAAAGSAAPLALGAVAAALLAALLL